MSLSAKDPSAAPGDVHVDDQSYDVIATAAEDDRVHVLKDDTAFAILDRWGDIRARSNRLGTQGLYLQDTRFLSSCRLLVEGARPLLLSSTVGPSGTLLVIHFMNPDVQRGGVLVLPHGAVHVSRTFLLREGLLRQRLRLTNFARTPVELSLQLDIAADFVDVFEVRGHVRERRGVMLEPVFGATPASSHTATHGEGTVTLGYRGLDGIERHTTIHAHPAPTTATASSLGFRVRLEPGQSRAIVMSTRCTALEPTPTPRPSATPSAADADAHAARLQTGPADTHVPRKRLARRHFMQAACRVTSTSVTLDSWLERSRNDLRMMLSDTPHGPYPHAGVPWFSAPFGRDAIITALETLWLDPSLARGVLSFLAATQATAVDAARDAEPGKIIHEMRAGEMANVGDVPFGRYYGSADATPLFVMLAGAYLHATGDVAFAHELWPHVDAAMQWLAEWGDADKDGFVEYRGERGKLVNQGWKDSHDSVFHEDGSDAKAPIALCEVQGYAFAAHRAAALVARAVEKFARAEREEHLAHELRARFDAAFWLEDLSTYALALDGDKRACRVVTSNAGHVLWTGLALPQRAARVASTLLDPKQCFSGWGVRTVARGAARYNPMSYHNGSVWPHDNAIIAAGFARYRLMREATRVFTAILDAARTFEMRRLPELFCGFGKTRREGPTLYPVACSPQAWAAGSVYMLLQASLGLTVNAHERRIVFAYPQLPASVRELEIHGIKCGEASVDIALHRYDDGVGIDVRARTGDVDVLLLK